jgi:hypothetical protein
VLVGKRYWLLRPQRWSLGFGVSFIAGELLSVPMAILLTDNGTRRAGSAWAGPVVSMTASSIEDTKKFVVATDREKRRESVLGC